MRLCQSFNTDQNTKGGPMSEQNKTLARRFYDEVMNKKNLNAIDELGSPDFVDHSAMPGQAPGLKGVKESTEMFLKAFPDMKMNVEEIIAEKDIVAARVSGTGTHKGEFMGAPATGKRVSFHGIDMIRFKGGKVVEVWHYGDDATLMAQLGVKMPAA
jgi:steroid delta-isomerase-like uncharacterized protein